MKNTKWLMRVWFGLTLLAGGNIQMGQAYTTNMDFGFGSVTYAYTRNESAGTVSISSVDVSKAWSSGGVTIPAKIGGYDVTHVGNSLGTSVIAGSFRPESKETNYWVYLPDTLLSIGAGAFADFKGDEVRWGRSIKDVGAGAFTRCRNLRQVRIEDLSAWSKTEFATATANPLYYAHRLMLTPQWQLITSLDVPAGTPSIGSYAFAGASATSLTIPNTCITVGDGAFMDCTGLTTLTILANTLGLGSNVFQGCRNLKKVTLSGDISGNFSSEGGPFDGCSQLAQATLNGAVTSIPAYCFWNVSSLTNVSIGANVKQFGSHAFAGCTGLTTVTIPEGATKVGDSAFSGCTSLRKVSLPSSLQHIDTLAFSGCVNLEAVSTSPGLPNVPARVFFGCKKLKSIRLSGKTAASPNGVTYIGTSAFNGCTSLASVDMSTGTTPALKTIQIISDNAFSNCTSLTSFAMPSSTTFIGKSAFNNCKGLTSITITGYVTGLGACAFNGCSKLAKVKIWGDITNSYLLAERPFAGCTKLTDVSFGGNAGKVPSYCFYHVSTLTNVNLGGNVRRIEAHAFNNCTNLGAIAIPDSVTAIMGCAFMNCKKFKEVMIPRNVTTVGSTVFTNCTSMKTVRVPETWKGTEKLANLAVPAGCQIIYYALGTTQTLTFVGNGGEPAFQTNIYTIGQAHGALPVPTREGYEFAGWWNARTGGVETVSTTIVANISVRSLFAHWTPCTQTVTFDANEGSCATETGTYTVDTAYTSLPGASREGFAFAGWWTEEDGGTQVTEGATVSTDLERTLYAHWKLLATETTPVAVPHGWLAEFGMGDGTEEGYEAAANAKAANGLAVWECFVAGLDPTDKDAEFKAEGWIEDGKVKVGPVGGAKEGREYRMMARTKLMGDEGWTDVTGQEERWIEDGWRFFKVGVSLRNDE